MVTGLLDREDPAADFEGVDRAAEAGTRQEGGGAGPATDLDAWRCETYDRRRSSALWVKWPQQVLDESSRAYGWTPPYSTSGNPVRPALGAQTRSPRSMCGGKSLCTGS